MALCLFLDMSAAKTCRCLIVDFLQLNTSKGSTSFYLNASMLFLSPYQHTTRTWSKVTLECNTYGKHWRTSPMVSSLLRCICCAESVQYTSVIEMRSGLWTDINGCDWLTDRFRILFSEDRSRFLRFVTGRSRLPAPIYVFPDKQGSVQVHC